MTETSTDGASGGCLCGAVRYRVKGPLGEAHACHCGQCRRQAGHFVVGVNIDWSAVEVDGGDALTWYPSSPGVKRGFCARCGSSLFWVSEDFGAALLAGSIDPPTNLSLASHIFVANKGDYYEITDDLPQHASYPGAEMNDGGS